MPDKGFGIIILFYIRISVKKVSEQDYRMDKIKKKM